jgi:alpha-L-fucosidase 2
MFLKITQNLTNAFIALAMALPTAGLRAQVPDLVGGPLGIERVAAHALHQNGYQSPRMDVKTASAWIQIDLGKIFPIDEIKLFPDVQNNGWYGNPNSRIQFPQRFKIETAKEGDSEFKSAQLFFDHTEKSCDGKFAHKVEKFKPAGGVVAARYVRLTVVKPPQITRGNWSFRLWRFEVFSGGRDVAEGCNLSDSFKGALGKHDLLRPPRGDGELAHFDHPENVTAPETWRRVNPPLTTPRGGITVGGFFGTLLKRNENYLLNGFTVRDMARDFRQRAGKPVPPKRDYRPNDNSPWLKVLGGSNAGRFLMGAGNQLRWLESKELRRWVNELIDEIGNCVEPSGYSYGFPERNMLEGGEEGAYARSWFTMGLIDTGIAGNNKAFRVARRANDWFNNSPYLPEMLLHASFGEQGMIPSTRLYLETPVGVPADIQVMQRYFQQNHWLSRLTARDSSAINLYEYDRPHSYLLNPLNAYMDMYFVTGDKKYLNAALGGWDIFHNDFEHIGGTIAICEGTFFPAKSYYLRKNTGELCGNVFWAYLNQQFRLLNPEEEKYVNEIEKSIYNALAANQSENGDIIYTAYLVAPKHTANDDMRNTCCEGQGTRMLGALPEFIYKIASDGIYVDLFNESTVNWKQGDADLTLKMRTEFPEKPDVKLQLSLQKPTKSKIRVRVPSWAAKPVDIFVNGKLRATGKPGQYVALEQTWNNNDEIQFKLPMELRLTKYTGIERGFENAYAIEYGPVLLAVITDYARSGKGVIHFKFTAEEFLKKLKPVENKPLHFFVDDPESAGVQIIPYYAVKENLLYKFTCFPNLKKSVAAKPVATVTPKAPVAPKASVAEALVSDTAPPKHPDTIWCSKPAKNWFEFMPIGNGRLGATIGGNVFEEKIHLNEDTIWSGEPRDLQRPENYKVLPGIRKLLLEGKGGEAQKEINKKMLGTWQCSYEPLGDLILKTPKQGGENAAVTQYRRELDLREGIVKLSYQKNGVKFEREAFASHPDQVIVFHWKSSQPEALSLDVSLASQLKYEVVKDTAGDIVVLTGNAPTIVNPYDRGVKNLVFENNKGIKFAQGIRIVTDGKTKKSGATLNITGATDVKIYFTANNSYTGPFTKPDNSPEKTRQLVAQVAKRLETAVKKPFDELKQAHIADYQSFFNRVKLDIPPTERASLPMETRLRNFSLQKDPQWVALYYQFGRYLLISGSRPGTQPMNLQGIWNKDLVPAWASNWTLNCNAEINYWPVETANLSELHEPLVRLTKELTVDGAKTAKNLYNARGWIAHHNADVWRTTWPVGGTGEWAIYQVGGAWLCYSIYDHYRFTGDKKFLEEIYPVLKGASQFYLDTLQDDAHGYLTTNPTVSFENRYRRADGFVGWASCGAMQDVQIIRALFRNTVEAAKTLGQDEAFQQEIKTALKRLPPNKISPKRGDLQEWVEDWDTAANNGQVAHGWALNPDWDISPITTPELAEAMRKTLERRKVIDQTCASWQGSMLAGNWARLHDGKKVEAVFDRHVQRSVRPSLISTFFGSSWQNDGNLGMTSALGESLLQSRPDGEITELHILPALLPSLKSGGVKGLAARGGFIVDIDWNEKEIKAVIHPTWGTKCRLRFNGKTEILTFASKEPQTRIWTVK